MKLGLVTQPYGLEDIDHTRYSPDLTSYSFSTLLTPYLNLAAKRFTTDVDVKQAVSSAYKQLAQIFSTPKHKPCGRGVKIA